MNLSTNSIIRLPATSKMSLWRHYIKTLPFVHPTLLEPEAANLANIQSQPSTSPRVLITWGNSMCGENNLRELTQADGEALNGSSSLPWKLSHGVKLSLTAVTTQHSSLRGEWQRGWSAWRRCWTLATSPVLRTFRPLNPRLKMTKRDKIVRGRIKVDRRISRLRQKFTDSNQSLTESV